mmetsp:Transcript_28249/g.81709  ORF Transcript_28249/g.81709 Transcript_28249/m.81709 type:complete len:227 (-) Transcript_28249:141-821(-)
MAVHHHRLGGFLEKQSILRIQICRGQNITGQSLPIGLLSPRPKVGIVAHHLPCDAKLLAEAERDLSHILAGYKYLELGGFIFRIWNHFRLPCIEEQLNSLGIASSILNECDGYAVGIGRWIVIYCIDGIIVAEMRSNCVWQIVPAIFHPLVVNPHPICGRFFPNITDGRNTALLKPWDLDILDDFGFGYGRRWEDVARKPFLYLPLPSHKIRIYLSCRRYIEDTVL